MISQSNLTKIFALSSLAILISACGGGGGSSDNSNGNNGTPPVTNSDLFSLKAQTWTIEPKTNTTYCYDIDTQKEIINCENNNDWDLKFHMGSRTPALFTNSGVSGPGNGGALSSPFNSTWLDLLKEKDATQGGAIPAAAWIVDSYSNAFMDTKSGFNSFFEYDLFGDHRMSPNFKTFLVTTDTSKKNAVGTTDKPVYALQITGYYKGTTSGHIGLRYVNTNQPSDLKELVVDATQGWNYVNLATETVSKDRNSQWQIAFNRYNVEVNSNVGSSIALQPEGFYDAQGAVILNKFKDTTAVESTKSALTTASEPKEVTSWGSNSIKSILNPSVQGTYPSKLSYGWYFYYPTLQAAQADGLQAAHVLAANPDAGSMIRGNLGNSYARLHLKEIKYADPKNSTSQTTWTFEFDIQLAR
jgi:hypothetical protein